MGAYDLLDLACKAIHSKLPAGHSIEILVAADAVDYCVTMRDSNGTQSTSGVTPSVMVESFLAMAQPTTKTEAPVDPYNGLPEWAPENNPLYGRGG